MILIPACVLPTHSWRWLPFALAATLAISAVVGPTPSPVSAQSDPDASSARSQSPTKADGLVTSDDSIRQALDDWLKTTDSPGVAAAVVHRGGSIRLAAAGRRKLGSDVPFQPTDKVHIGSCTKAMTAALIGMLVQDGLLDWDSTIADVLPELAIQIHPDYGSVSLEQLLCHRSGMPANARNWWLQRGDSISATRRAIAIDSLHDKPVAAPGEKFIYSNLGYMVAGLMAEARTGYPWETLIQERLFDPLKMSTAGFGPTGSADKLDQPWGHAGTKPPLRAVQHDNAPALGPAGRVHCSIADWAQFARMMMGEFPEILNDATLRRLSRVPDVYRSDGQNYGYGWVIVRRGWAGGETLTHAGSKTYWSAVIWVAPRRGTTYLAATNAATESSMRDLDRVIQKLIQMDRGR